MHPHSMIITGNHKIHCINIRNPNLPDALRDAASYLDDEFHGQHPANMTDFKVRPDGDDWLVIITVDLTPRN